MGLRLLKPVRTFMYRARLRSPRYHRKKWAKMRREKGETAGTFYYNFAGEKFKVVRESFTESKVLPGRFNVNIRVDVLKGNKSLAQSTLIDINREKKVVEIADLNRDVNISVPKNSLRGRNIFRTILEESIEIGKEQFGNDEFRLVIVPANKSLKRLFEEFGFRYPSKKSSKMELKFFPQ